MGLGRLSGSPWEAFGPPRGQRSAAKTQASKENEMSKYLPKVGDVAEYTFPTGDKYMRPGEHDGQTAIGEVVKAGKSYADVQWREGRKERIYFAHPGHSEVIFKAQPGA